MKRLLANKTTHVHKLMVERFRKRLPLKMSGKDACRPSPYLYTRLRISLPLLRYLAVNYASHLPVCQDGW